MNNLFFSTFVVLAALLVAAHLTTAAPSCGDVAAKAATCVSYAMGKAPKPAATCCTGLQALAKTVKSLDDKKAICRCLKAGVKNFAGVQDKFLQQIPGACNIKVGFPVSLSVNCETIH